MRQRLAAANWKMNGLSRNLWDITNLAEWQKNSLVEILFCPPATLIHPIAKALTGLTGTSVQIGGQDCHTHASGPHTGDISAEMLRDCGATYVILGHSERRHGHDEQNILIRAKAETALRFNLTPIICIGESGEDRQHSRTLDIVTEQLEQSVPDVAADKGVVIAYEPVWAIGTGKTPSIDQINDVHMHIRKKLDTRFGSETGQRIRLLYGGSVKPSNAEPIFQCPYVDGALVGGASLDPRKFSAIIDALGST